MRNRLAAAFIGTLAGIILPVVCVQALGPITGVIVCSGLYLVVAVLGALYLAALWPFNRPFPWERD